MHINREQSSIVVTQGHEQPPLEYGPQRLHYIYSVGIPQAYLTLFSILQSVVFGILLLAIPLPQTITLPTLWLLLLRQYLYLPYIISLGMLILIWLHQVSITLTGKWPHSFFQVGIVTILTLFEVFAARTIAILPSWLFFTGCISFVGGITLMRTGTTHLPEDFDTSSSFQKFGHSLKQSEMLRGKQYISIGAGLIALAVGYDNLISFVKAVAPSLVSSIPWGIYLIACVLLSMMVLTRHYRSKQHRRLREMMYASTDIYIKNGIARYRKAEKSEQHTALNIALASKDFSQIHSREQKTTPGYQFLRSIVGAAIVSVILQLLIHKNFFKRL